MNKLIITDADSKKLISTICRDISTSGWRPDYVVGLTRGGLLPAVMISHWFNIPCETLTVSLRDGKQCESNLWMSEDAFGYVRATAVPRPVGEPTSDAALRKNILIVDDINDSGATLNWIREDWPSSCLPDDPAWREIWGNNVRFAAMVNNEASDFKDVDYVGLTINKLENPVWCVFPWEEWWGR